MLKIYTYNRCDTCRKAVKFLKEKGVDFEEYPIRETPPTREELTRMLSYYDGDIKPLFNRSGQDYRALNMKEKLPTLSPNEALSYLNQNGNLIKRPFVLGKDWGCVGFSQDLFRV